MVAAAGGDLGRDTTRHGITPFIDVISGQILSSRRTKSKSHATC